MTLQLVRFRTDDDAADQVRSQLGKVFDALRLASPRGVAYTAYASASEPEFILALELDAGAENPLPQLPEAGHLQDLISHSTGAPVPPELFTVVGSYVS